MRFSLLGDGYIAQHHKRAIECVGKLVNVYDVKYGKPFPKDFYETDYVVICTPSWTHREYTKQALSFGSRVIVEKPMCLPWEQIIDDDDINIVLQYRYLPLPKTADKVSVKFVRDNKYFDSWKGDPKLTGGLLYNLFIHYIDLAILLGADFEGVVTSEGSQERKIDDFDILSVDNQSLYDNMYQEIVRGNGVKPKDIMYLHWQMSRHSELCGYGSNGLNTTIKIGHKLL